MPTPSLRLPGLPPIRVSGATAVMVVLIAVLVQPSFAVLPALSAGAAIGLSVLLALCLVVSILLHELAHAFSARAAGAQVDHIALTLWGGHTTYRSRRVSHGASVLISLSGPATNLLIGLLALLASSAAPDGGAAQQLLSLLSTLNLTLTAFNLLPGLPMDGGRALESILAAVLGSSAVGTRITAWIGRGIAVVVLAIPLLSLGSLDLSYGIVLLIWGAMIAMMLWQGASAALRAVRQQEALDGLSIADLARGARIVRADAPLSALEQSSLGAEQGALAVVIGSDGSAGLLDPDAVAAVPAHQRDQVPAGAVTAFHGPPGRISSTLEGEALLRALGAHGRALHLVIDPSGAVVGVITAADVRARLQGR